MSHIPFVIYLSSIMYLELLLKSFVGISLMNIGLVLTLIFSVSISFILSLVYNILPSNFNIVFLFISMVLLCILFASQLVYFKIFKTFYISYSAENVGKVLEFAKEAFFAIRKNIHLILLMLLPFILMLIFKSKIPANNEFHISLSIGYLVLSISFHLVALTLVNTGRRETNSPYNLYYNIHQPEFSVENLGMLTYLRLDAKRQIFGWDPRIELEGLISYPIDKIIGSNDVDKFNVLNIDFEILLKDESDAKIISMHEYFKSVTPTMKNDFTGLFKGHNLIFITAEGFSHLGVNENLTPTLFKMVNKGFYFENFYTPLWGVSTSDGEYVATTGLIPKAGIWSFSLSSKNYLPFTLGNQFKSLGYMTKAYHNHSYDYFDRDLSHPNIGYDYKGIGNGLIMDDIWPRSDLDMMKVTIPEYIDEDKFHAYYMTISGHLWYSFKEHAMARKNRNKVEHLDYSPTVKAYLASQIELDLALEYLESQLVLSGKADNTIIVLCSDHYPYGLHNKYIHELSGEIVDEVFKIYKNNLIIYKPGLDRVRVSKPASSLDILPTVSNLFGLDFDSRLLMGRDILSDHDPLVIFSNRSYISKYGKYDAKSNSFIPNSELDLSFDEIKEHEKRMSNIVDGRFFFSQRILEYDYYRKVLGK